MRKIPYMPIWFVMVLAVTAAAHAQKKSDPWIDMVTTTTFTSPGDVAHQQLMDAVEAQGGEVSPSYIERLKVAIERLRACLVDRDCSQQEYNEAVALANHLLDVLLLSTGVLEAREFTERRARAEM